MSAGLTVPTVHLNGSGGAALLQGYTEAAKALREALGLLENTSPNGRDYYPQGPEAIGRAQTEHQTRVTKLREVLSELRELSSAVRAAGRGP